MTTSVEVAGRHSERIVLTALELEELSSRVDGPVLRTGDEGWDDAVLLWNAMVQKSPAFVVQPTSARDVATAVGFARDRGLALSVKGGGHNIAGTAIAEDGLMLDMSRLRDISVDPPGRRVHAGAGCLLKHVDAATQRARPRNGARVHLRDRDGRAHPRRGVRLPHSTFRLDSGQPRGGRDRHRGRRGPHRQPRRERRAVLGGARWWRQLRGRDAVQLPPPRHRPDDHRRVDRVGRRTRRRGARGLPGADGLGAPRAHRRGDDPPRPTRTVRARGVASATCRRTARVPQRKDHDGRPGSVASRSASPRSTSSPRGRMSPSSRCSMPWTARA